MAPFRPSSRPIDRIAGRRSRIGSTRAVLLASMSAMLLLFASGGPVAAQSASELAGDLDRSGSSVDGAIGADLAEAIAAANDRGIGYVEGAFGDGDDATALAESIAAELDALGSSIHTVIVRAEGGVGGWSNVYDSGDVVAAIDAGFASFASGDNGAGLSAVASALGTGSSGGASSSSDSGGGSSGVLLGGVGMVAAGGGALWYRNKKRRERRIADDMEADRAEINEQLRDNADKVIDLGDAVLASGDAELQRLYTEASETYQDVSRSVEGAATPEAVDALDDRIDHAEWQFQVIEARLAGQPDPKSPAEVAAEAQAKRRAETAEPALGKDETIFDRSGSSGAPSSGGIPMPRGGRSVPRRRRGGMGPVIIGGGWGGGHGGSRRSQRRHGGGFGGSRGGGGGGRSFGGGGGGGRNF